MATAGGLVDVEMSLGYSVELLQSHLRKLNVHVTTSLIMCPRLPSQASKLLLPCPHSARWQSPEGVSQVPVLGPYGPNTPIRDKQAYTP